MGHGDPVELLGGVFVEVNVPTDQKIEEAKWVDKQLHKSSLPYGMVTGVDMTADITQTIDFNRTLARWRGFRHLLNYDENAPAKSMDKTINKSMFTE